MQLLTGWVKSAPAFSTGGFTTFERLGRFMLPSLARRVFGTGPVLPVHRRTAAAFIKDAPASVPWS